MIEEINEENFENKIGNGLKLVEFYATWCVYCKKQRIELGNIENNEIWIGIVDGDESPKLIKKLKIEGYPTFILFKNGKEAARFSGFHTKEQLLNKLMKLINN